VCFLFSLFDVNTCYGNKGGDAGDNLLMIWPLGLAVKFCLCAECLSSILLLKKTVCCVWIALDSGLLCITVLITFGVFVAIYVVRECRKLRRSRSGHRVLLCYILFVVRLSVFRRIAGEMCVIVTAVVIMSGSLRTKDCSALQSCVCVLACVCIRDVIGQMCWRSSIMFCQVRYGFRFVLCQNPYVC
jgi:hypothetical protein